MSAPSERSNPDQLFDELFEYLCGLHRLAAKRVTLDPGLIRAEVDARLGEAAARARRMGTEIEAEWRRLDRAIRCFIDDMVESIPDSKLESAWVAKHRFATGAGIGAGNVAFVQEIVSFLGEVEDFPPGDLDLIHKWRARFFYRCLLLAFQTELPADPGDPVEERPSARRSSTADLRARLVRLIGGAEPTAKVTPEAYANAQTQKLHLNSAPAMWAMAIIVVLFGISFFVVSGWMYRRASDRLVEAVKYLDLNLRISGSAPGGSNP